MTPQIGKLGEVAICTGDGREPGGCEQEDPLGAGWELHPDAVYVTDGGGEVYAARRLIRGGERIAEVILRVGRQSHLDRMEFAEVGGELALVSYQDGRVYAVDTVQIADGLITAYRRVINPGKLMRV